MILRHSMPTLTVCEPLTHVTASLTMNVGRVVMLPTLTPELHPIVLNPSLMVISGGTLWFATPAIFGNWSTNPPLTQPYPSFRFRYPIDMWLRSVGVRVRSKFILLTHEFCGSDRSSVAIACGNCEYNFTGARWCQKLANT